MARSRKRKPDMLKWILYGGIAFIAYKAILAPKSAAASPRMPSNMVAVPTSEPMVTVPTPEEMAVQQAVEQATSLRLTL